MKLFDINTYTQVILSQFKKTKLSQIIGAMITSPVLKVNGVILSVLEIFNVSKEGVLKLTPTNLWFWGSLIEIKRYEIEEYADFIIRYQNKALTMNSMGSVGDIIGLLRGVLNVDVVKYEEYKPSAFRIFLKRNGVNASVIRGAINEIKLAGVEAELLESVAIQSKSFMFDVGTTAIGVGFEKGHLSDFI